MLGFRTSRDTSVKSRTPVPDSSSALKISWNRRCFRVSTMVSLVLVVLRRLAERTMCSSCRFCMQEREGSRGFFGEHPQPLPFPPHIQIWKDRQAEIWMRRNADAFACAGKSRISQHVSQRGDTYLQASRHTDSRCNTSCFSCRDANKKSPMGRLELLRCELGWRPILGWKRRWPVTDRDSSKIRRAGGGNTNRVEVRPKQGGKYTDRQPDIIYTTENQRTRGKATQV